MGTSITSVHSDEELHMVCLIDSSGLRNCEWPTVTIILMSTMSHKCDKEPCCMSLVVFYSTGIHDLSAEITGMKEYQLITLLHF